METFSALLAICAGDSPVTGGFPEQKPVTQSFDVFFDLRLINNWVNNGEAGDLRRHRAHYDVTVMIWASIQTVVGPSPAGDEALLDKIYSPHICPYICMWQCEG